MSTIYTDRYGLPVSTQGQEAAAHYMEGIDRALALNMGAQESLETAIHRRLYEELGLRYVDTVKSMLDGQALPNAELLTARLRRIGSGRSETCVKTLIEKACQLVQEHDGKQRVAFLTHAQQARRKILRRGHRLLARRRRS
jgi:hypothetical protein